MPLLFYGKNPHYQIQVIKCTKSEIYHRKYGHFMYFIDKPLISNVGLVKHRNILNHSFWFVDNLENETTGQSITCKVWCTQFHSPLVWKHGDPELTLTTERGQRHALACQNNVKCSKVSVCKISDLIGS